MSRTTSPPADRRVGAADQSAPILEHDPATESVLEPGRIPALAGIAERCVLCFFHDAIATMVSGGSAKQVTELQSEMGPQPVYEFKESGRRLTLVQPGIGAPFSAAFMEELIALGCRHFIACGGAGVLRGDIVVGHLVVPTAAVRDEGTSYHYFPPSRELTPTPAAVTAIRTVLDEHGGRIPDGEDLDHGRVVSGNARQGRPPPRRGLSDGGNGMLGPVRGGPLSGRDVRADPVRRRRRERARVGPARLGPPD